jgi:hypothetical protein
MPTYQPMAPITYWLLFMASAFVTVLILVISWFFVLPSSVPYNDNSSPSVLPLAMEALLDSYDDSFQWTLDDWQIAQACLEDTFEDAFGIDASSPDDLAVFFPHSTKIQSGLTVRGIAHPKDWAKWHHHRYCKECGRTDSIPATPPSTHDKLWEQFFCDCMSQDPAFLDPPKDCTFGIFETEGDTAITSIVATWKSSRSAKVDEYVMLSCLVESYQTLSSPKLAPFWSTVRIEDTREIESLDNSQMVMTSVEFRLTKNHPAAILKRGDAVHRSALLSDTRATDSFWSKLPLSELWSLYRFHAVGEEAFCGCFQAGSERGSMMDTCQVNIFLPQDWILY